MKFFQNRTNIAIMIVFIIIYFLASSAKIPLISDNQNLIYVLGVLALIYNVSTSNKGLNLFNDSGLFETYNAQPVY